uniref:Uncharacterized protein n=1 Tax=Rhizophora mucronata TaxID=61149 RepID=A0A2P2P5I0_RHIMU
MCLGIIVKPLYCDLKVTCLSCGNSLVMKTEKRLHTSEVSLDSIAWEPHAL